MIHTVLGELLKGKGFHIVTGKPTDTVYDCVVLMKESRIGCLLIMEEGRIVGIFSERDVLMKIVAQKLDPEKTKVSEVMNRDVICVDPDTTIEEAMSIMTEKRIRHLPIMEDSVLMGMISVGDLTKWLSAQHRSHVQEINDLIHYINGGYSL